MIKIVIVILLVFNILACEPVQQASTKGKPQQQEPFVCLQSQNQCNINSKFGKFTIQFSGQIEQGRIKTELPFQIQLEFYAAKQGYHLKKVSSYLEGKSMYMGKIPIFFQPNEQTVNFMVADTLLASCSEDIMTWRLWLELEVVIDGGEVQQQKFFIDFDSQRL